HGTRTGHSRCYTLDFAAPEFFRDETSGSCDQYALGVTYCVLRGGDPPFTGVEEQIMAGHLYGEPDLSMLPPPGPPVAARALAKDPRSRWPDCRAFVAALRQAQAGPEGP